MRIGVPHGGMRIVEPAVLAPSSPGGSGEACGHGAMLASSWDPLKARWILRGPMMPGSVGGTKVRDLLDAPTRVRRCHARGRIRRQRAVARCRGDAAGVDAEGGGDPRWGTCRAGHRSDGGKAAGCGEHRSMVHARGRGLMRRGSGEGSCLMTLASTDRARDGAHGRRRSKCRRRPWLRSSQRQAARPAESASRASLAKATASAETARGYYLQSLHASSGVARLRRTARAALERSGADAERPSDERQRGARERGRRGYLQTPSSGSRGGGRPG